MSNNKYKDGKILATFRTSPKDLQVFSDITHNQFGHGGITIVLNSLIKEYIEKFEGKTTKLDTFLDPNFTPKPIAFDDLDKVVTPFAMQLSDQELHRLRIWAFQTHTICTAYSKLSAQRRKITKMSYDECMKVLRRSENGV